MEITKSSRHQKIIGNLGENLVCNWLSRSGFEVTIIDHTGIDIIAYNPKSKKRIGITVKSRTRTSENDKASIYILSYRKKKDDRKKLLEACKAFACEPWIAIYVERPNSGDLFLTSLENYDKKYRSKSSGKIDDWKMTDKYLSLYKSDPNVKHIKINFETSGWSWK